MARTKGVKQINRDFIRSALKLIYTILAQIFFPYELKQLLRTLLKARGTYLSRLGNEGRRTLRILNHINVEDIRKAIKESGKKTLRETRDKRVAIDFHTIPQG
ncbi:hypothetical protein HNQ62_002671 [Sulfurisphaera ohwakuensis]|uniref:Uncharacterized protein n=1 Tax=Sulfurisphaera ohwakuensis TaxID=69656 RepID=A0A7J9RV71_SULOH|nr:hypothetical protein [Sulfurisphaera ohwakuensis]